MARSESGASPDPRYTQSRRRADGAERRREAEGKTARLMDWLNDYYGSDDPGDHGAWRGRQTVCRRSGDGPVWRAGATPERSRNRRRCSACGALAMGERLQQLNAEWMAQRQPTVAMRIGIHTGPVVAGSLIGKRRQSSACARSAIKSATSSIPTDSRTSPSSIPSSRRTAGGTEA